MISKGVVRRFVLCSILGEQNEVSLGPRAGLMFFQLFFQSEFEASAFSNASIAAVIHSMSA